MRNKVSAGGQFDAQRATPAREIDFGIYVAVEPRRGVIGLWSGVITIVYADADVDCSWWHERGADGKIWRRGLIGEPKIRNSKRIFDDPMDRMN
jgi:hypothetical protein